MSHKVQRFSTVLLSALVICLAGSCKSEEEENGDTGTGITVNCGGTIVEIGPQCAGVYHSVRNCCVSQMVGQMKAAEVVCSLGAKEEDCQAYGSTAVGPACAELQSRPECGVAGSGGSEEGGSGGQGGSGSVSPGYEGTDCSQYAPWADNCIDIPCPDCKEAGLQCAVSKCVACRNEGTYTAACSDLFGSCFPAYITCVFGMNCLVETSAEVRAQYDACLSQLNTCCGL